MNTITLDIETIPLEFDELSDDFKANVNAAVEREIKYTEETDLELVRNRVMATNSIYGKIVVIGLQHNNEKPYAFYGEDEADLLRNFWDDIKNYTGTFVHFNGLRFDVPFILNRSASHKIIPTNKSFLMKRRFSYFPHFDCYAAITDWGNQRAITLKTACEFLGVQSPKEGEVVAKDVYQFVKDGKILEVAEYCARDVVATKKVYDVLSKYYN